MLSYVVFSEYYKNHRLESRKVTSAFPGPAIPYVVPDSVATDFRCIVFAFDRDPSPVTRNGRLASALPAPGFRKVANTQKAGNGLQVIYLHGYMAVNDK